MTSRPTDETDMTEPPCPVCRADLRPIMYGMPAPPLPDGVILGGCVILESNPTHGCERCGWRGFVDADGVATATEDGPR